MNGTGAREQGDLRGALSWGPEDSPGSRSGLSPDTGCSETPGVSCPGAPTLREVIPRPPFRSVRPGFSAGETWRGEGGNEIQ